METQALTPAAGLAPAPRLPQAAKGADMAAVEKTARSFEAVFVSQMLNHMFSGIETDGLFGGGHSEQMFRSLLTDEYGKMIANRGNGIGVADAVRRSLLAQQEV